MSPAHECQAPAASLAGDTVQGVGQERAGSETVTVSRVAETEIGESLGQQLQALLQACFPGYPSRSYFKLPPHFRYLAMKSGALAAQMGVELRVIRVGSNVVRTFGVAARDTRLDAPGLVQARGRSECVCGPAGGIGPDRGMRHNGLVDADVVVIGAGALGLSTALHCAMDGRSVAVVERHTAGSQASGRAAGLFKSVQADELRTRLAPVAEHRGGLFTMSPDSRFIAGPVPDLPGLWVASGCNGSGFSSSLAIGEALATWITSGAPPPGMTALSPGRFGPLSDDALLTRGLWQYAHYYNPVTTTTEATTQTGAR